MNATDAFLFRLLLRINYTRPFVDFGRKAAAAVFAVHWPSNIDVIDRYYWLNGIAHVKLSENITSEFQSIWSGALHFYCILTSGFISEQADLTFLSIPAIARFLCIMKFSYVIYLTPRGMCECKIKVLTVARKLIFAQKWIVILLQQ